MRVIAVTRTLGSGEEHVDAQGSMRELDAILPRCDFLAVTCPLNDETRGLIDARRLALCKAELVIINIARAAVLDEEALYTRASRPPHRGRGARCLVRLSDGRRTRPRDRRAFLSTNSPM